MGYTNIKCTNWQTGRTKTSANVGIQAQIQGATSRNISPNVILTLTETDNQLWLYVNSPRFSQTGACWGKIYYTLSPKSLS